MILRSSLIAVLVAYLGTNYNKIMLIVHLIQ